ncbi:MAG: hypothetical protein ABI183_09595, partial [Polyangiaceae bacterium]
MKTRLRDILATHLILLIAATVVLYPVLWVVRLAVSPEGQLTQAGAALHPTSQNFHSFFFAHD